MTIADLRWMDQAICTQDQADLFFPDRVSHETVLERGTRARREAEAKAICAACPVQEVCLEYALTDDDPPVGIWGGKTFGERRRIARARELGVSVDVLPKVGRPPKPKVEIEHVGISHIRVSWATNPINLCNMAPYEANPVGVPCPRCVKMAR